MTVQILRISFKKVMLFHFWYLICKMPLDLEEHGSSSVKVNVRFHVYIHLHQVDLIEIVNKQSSFSLFWSFLTRSGQ